jgi:hypothetical protein
MALDSKRPRGTRKNHKRGIAAAHKEKLRKEAEERQKKYAALPFEEKLARAGAKEKAKLLARQQNQKRANK